VKAFKAALFSKMAGSAFATSIGSRLYDGRAPQNPTWPYAVYYLISSVPDRTFAEDMTDCIVQFSVFSAASAQTEILDIGTNLIALYDNAVLTASGWKQIFMELANGEGEVTDYPADTLTGTGAYFQYDIDFNVKLSRS
jgi:hypothetical protein